VGRLGDGATARRASVFICCHPLDLMTQRPPDSDDRPSKGIIVRDLLLFQMKLWLDGFKDIVLSPISVVAAALDMLRGSERSSLFYRTLQLGEGFDQWLNLYGAAQRAPTRSSGLVGDDGDEMTRPLEVWGRRAESPSTRTPPMRPR